MQLKLHTNSHIPELNLEFTKNSKGFSKFAILDDLSHSYILLTPELRKFNIKSMEPSFCSYLPIKDSLLSKSTKLQYSNNPIIINLTSKCIICKSKKDLFELSQLIILINI